MATIKKKIIEEKAKPKVAIKKTLTKKEISKKITIEKKPTKKTVIKKAIKPISEKIEAKIITKKTVLSKELVPLNDLLINTIIEAIKDIKGENIVTIDLRKLHDRFTDFFIICEATTNTQLQGIAGNIEKKVKEICKEKVYKKNAEKESLWMILDYVNTVVHLFLPEQRAFYNLEECWSDGKISKIKS